MLNIFRAKNILINEASKENKLSDEHELVILLLYS
jgi:hypothetical protein